MLSTIAVTREQIQARHDRITSLLVLSLLTVRMLNSVLGFLAYPSSPLALAAVNYGYMLCTVLLTAGLIWWERTDLARFHIGKLSLIFILLSQPVLILLAVLRLVPAIYFLTGLVFLPIWSGLAVILRKSEDLNLRNPASLLRSIGFGVMVSVPLALFIGWLLTLQSGPNTKPFALAPFVLAPIVNMALAGVQEEPLFRGFLWGWLEKQKLPALAIWLIQAVLFWLAHLYYVNEMPISFWIVCPVGGLMLGLVAWRGRDIAPSMVAHGLYNGLAQVVAGVF